MQTGLVLKADISTTADASQVPVTLLISATFENKTKPVWLVLSC